MCVRDLDAGPLGIIVQLYKWLCLFCMMTSSRQLCEDLWLKGFSVFFIFLSILIDIEVLFFPHLIKLII